MTIPNRIPTVTTIGLALEDTYIAVRKGNEIVNMYLESYSPESLTLVFGANIIEMSPTGNISENAVLWQNMEHSISVIFKQNNPFVNQNHSS